VAWLTVPASPESLIVVRQHVRDRMIRLGLDGRTDDALLAVNEAVANAVVHAYPTRPGHVDVDLSETGAGVLITVRDYGRGPYGHDDTAGGGFGFGIMQAVADSARISAPTDGGTEVRLTFDR
jgi:two-component sensor histidine kinase